MARDQGKAERKTLMLLLGAAGRVALCVFAAAHDKAVPMHNVKHEMIDYSS